MYCENRVSCQFNAQRLGELYPKCQFAGGITWEEGGQPHVIPFTSYRLAQLHNDLSIREFFLHASRQNIICITEMCHLNIFVIFVGRKCFTFPADQIFLSFLFIQQYIQQSQSLYLKMKHNSSTIQPLGEMHVRVRSLINQVEIHINKI